MILARSMSAIKSLRFAAFSSACRDCRHRPLAPTPHPIIICNAHQGVGVLRCRYCREYVDLAFASGVWGLREHNKPLKKINLEHGFRHFRLPFPPLQLVVSNCDHEKGCMGAEKCPLYILICQTSSTGLFLLAKVVLFIKSVLQFVVIAPKHIVSRLGVVL